MNRQLLKYTHRTRGTYYAQIIAETATLVLYRSYEHTKDQGMVKLQTTGARTPGAFHADWEAAQ